jgi:hypothetical protein
MQPIVDDAQRRSVEGFLEAVVRDANYMADLTAAFLNAHGIRPKKGLGASGCALPANSSTLTRAHGVLMNMAAALRIRSWERAGLRPQLPADLPSSSEAFRNLVPEVVGSPEGTPVVPELSAKVFRTWLQRFSRSSRAALSTDVMLPTKTVSQEDLLEALADFLWANRHLADVKGR